MKTIISLILSAFFLPVFLSGQQKQSDYLKEQAINCNNEVKELDKQLMDLQARKQRTMKEYLDGVYCSVCERTPTEIRHEENEEFQQHLEKVSGVAKRPTQAQINQKEKKFTDEFTRLGMKRANKISSCSDLKKRYQDALDDEARKAAEEKAERDKHRQDSLEKIRQDKIERDKHRQDSIAQVKAEKERRDKEIRDSLEQEKLEKQQRAQAYLDSLEAVRQANELARRQEVRELTQDFSNALHETKQELDELVQQGSYDVNNSINRVEGATSNRSWTDEYRAADELGGDVFQNRPSTSNNDNFTRETLKKWVEEGIAATHRLSEQCDNFMGKSKELLREVIEGEVIDALRNQLPHHLQPPAVHLQVAVQGSLSVYNINKGVWEVGLKAIDDFMENRFDYDRTKGNIVQIIKENTPGWSIILKFGN